MSEELYRHDLEAPKVTFQLAEPPPGWIEAIEAHLSKHLGKCLGVFHEIISTNVHLDLYFYEASPTRPFRTVVTIGVSNAPQNVPEDADEYRHIELMLYLPPDWPMDFHQADALWRDENFWPMRMLKDAGRMVHTYNTCLLPGHTMSRAGEPGDAYYPGCIHNSTLVLPPFKEPNEFDTLSTDGKRVRFLQVFPITDAETKFKSEHGMLALLDQINATGTDSLVIDPKRPCSCEPNQAAAAPVQSTPARSKPAPFVARQEEPSSGCFGKIAGALAFLAVMGVVRMVVRTATNTPSRPTTTYNFNRPANPDATVGVPSPGNSSYRLHANEEVALDRYLGLRATMITGRGGGVLINQSGYKFEPALSALLAQNPQAAVPRFVLYSMLKFARPIKAAIKSNVRQSGMEDYYKPLETLGSESIEKESPLGRAFTQVLLERGNVETGDFKNAEQYTAAEVLAWWHKHSADFDRYDQLESWFQDSWTRQYVAPKLKAPSTAVVENVPPPKAVTPVPIEIVPPQKVEAPKVVEPEPVNPKPIPPEPVKPEVVTTPDALKPVKPGTAIVPKQVSPPKPPPVAEDATFADRLQALLPKLNADYSNGPWNWPDFEVIDKPALAAALKEVEAKTPNANPAVRLWMAACRLSFGVDGSEKEFADALELVKNDSPLQYNSIQQRLLDSMAQAGIKQVLPFLAAQAERDHANLTRVRAQRDDVNAFYPPILRKLHELLGWPAAAPGKNSGPEIERVKKWIGENLAELKWDRERKRYISQKPPPGMDVLYTAAKTVETAYGLNALDLTRPGIDSTTMLRALLAAVREKPDAPAEAKSAACNVVQIVLERRVAGEIQNRIDSIQSPILIELSTLLPEIPSKVLQVALDKQLPEDANHIFTDYFRNEPWNNKMPAAATGLLTHYEKNLKAALQAENNEAQLQAAMGVLFTGGKVEFEDFKRMTDKASQEWGRWEGKLEQWNRILNLAGRTGALRMALLRAQCQERLLGKDIFKDFCQMCQWEDTRQPNQPYPQHRSERMAAAVEWLNKNEEQLHFDFAKNAFVGVVAPHKAEIFEAMQRVPEKFGLKADEVMPLGGVALATPKVLALLEQNDEARSDPACQELLTVLHKYNIKDRVLCERVRNLLPLIPYEAAVNVIATELVLNFDYIFKRKGYAYTLTDLQQKVDSKLLDGARALLLPDYEKKFKAAKPEEYRPALLQYLYCGGSIDPKTLDDTIKSSSESEFSQMRSWSMTTQRAGYVDVIGIILGVARYREKDRNMTYAEFESFTGTRGAGPFRTPAVDELDEIFAWYVQYKDKLIWNDNLHRFGVPEGVPLPPNRVGRSSPDDAFRAQKPQPPLPPRLTRPTPPKPTTPQDVEKDKF